MHSRDAWEKCGSGPQTIKGKTYRSLTEFKRPCSTCGEPFSIFVTNKIASGHADSNSFGLKNCERHRQNKSIADNEELERLREWEEVFHRALRLVQKKLGPHATMSKMDEHIALLIKATDEVFAEATRMRAELAKYELQPAMVEAQKVTAMNGALPNKMPWE
jgi:hypothetical protein